MKIEIKEAKYPRKATEYAVTVLSDEGKYLMCAHPYTAYKIQAEIVKKAFDVLLANGGENDILEAIKELP